MTGRRFGGKVAAEIGFVTLSVPLASLREETMNIAREIAAKDPWALKATKDSYRYSLEMPWDASMNYTAAKEEELANMQKVRGWKEGGVADFVEGKFKPGLEGHETIGKT
jgi:trans-feruloyl-CoA hydratase/vanillin synthase